MLSCLWDGAFKIFLVAMRQQRVSFLSLRMVRNHSEQAVIAHACHGHRFQLLTGLSVSDRRLVVSSKPVKC